MEIRGHSWETNLPARRLVYTRDLYPVSYTHLDVYKRQLFTSLIILRDHAQNSHIQILGNIFLRVDLIVDVYKRQRQDHIQFPT